MSHILSLNQSQLQVRNLITNPFGSAALGTLQGGSVTSSATGSLDVTTVKIGSRTSSIKITPNGTVSDTYWAFGDVNFTLAALQPGRTYTASGWFYQAAAQTSSFASGPRPRGIRFFYSVNSGSGGPFPESGSQAPNIAGLQRVVYTFTVPSNAVQAFLRFYNGSEQTADVCWWTNLMLTEGATVHDYADGDTPGWKWDGTPGASTSVGYDYTIGSVFGTPFTQSYNPALGTIVDKPASQPFTVYSVSTSTSFSTAPGIYSTGNASGSLGSPLVVRLLGTGTGFRVDRSHDDAAPWLWSVSQVATTGKAQITAVVTTATGASLSANGNAPQNITHTSTTWHPLNANKIYVGIRDGSTSYANGNTTIQAILTYAGTHTAPQQLAVSAWLANKYGVALA